MKYLSATDLDRSIATIVEAAQEEPVVIRNDRQDLAVVLSAHEYARLRALNAEEFKRFCDRIGERAVARGLTEEKLAAMLADER